MRRLITADAVVTAKGTQGSSILVENSSVVAIGDGTDFSAVDAAEERYPDATIVPGFRDAHIHAVPYAALLGGCSLKSAVSMDDLVARLEAFAATLPASTPVVATRFDDEHLTEHRLPTRFDLDRAVPDRPAVIYRYCGHIAVANTAALLASAVDASTADPAGGSLDRDIEGVPNGVLRETAAGLIAPSLSRGRNLDPSQLLAGLGALATLGITSIGAMIGYGEQPSEELEAEVDLWCEIANELPIKIHGITITDDPAQLAAAARRLSDAGPRLRWHGVKRFADGSLGGHTAAMRTDFSDAPTSGTYRLTPADIAIARESLGLGGAVCIHAIGDRAVGSVLDVFEGLIAEGADPTRLRMEHVSIASPEQIIRFAELGVTACIQPAFLASESDWVFDRVGSDRRTWVYPFNTMRSKGIPLSGSSDSPVEPPHPLWGMSAAVGRHGINPDEALSPLQALDLFTRGGAQSLGEPEPLSVGSPADLLVLDTDPSRASPSELHATSILATYIDGAALDLDRSQPVWID